MLTPISPNSWTDSSPVRLISNARREISKLGPIAEIGILYLLICSLLLVTVEPSNLERDSFGTQFGSIDYIEYWSALRVLSGGRNPYDPTEILKEQLPLYQGWQESGGLNLDPQSIKPLMMWNPPWLLVLIAPVVALPFTTSVTAWLISNVFLIIGGGLLLQSGLKASRSSLLWLLPGMFLFHPIYFSLEYGQMGALLLFGCALVFHGMMKNCISSQSAGLVVLSLKPHLFILVFVLTLLECFFTQKGNGTNEVKSLPARFKPILLAILLIAALCIPIEARSPGTTLQWLRQLMPDSASTQDGGAYKWYTSALFSVLPKFCLQIRPNVTHSQIPWCEMIATLRFSVPLILVYLTIKLWMEKRNAALVLHKLSLLRPSFLRSEDFFFALIASVTFAPFAWHFDFAPLALAQAFAVHRAITVSSKNSPLSYLLVALYFGLSLVGFILERWGIIVWNDEYFFFPITFLTIFIIDCKLREPGQFP